MAAAAHPRRIGAGDLADEAHDLPIAERLAGERPGASVAHQGGGMAHHQMEGVGALLVHDLDEAI